MTALLQGALSHRLKGWRFDTLLTPGGGHTGFRGRFKQPDAAYRIWAKSGTMRYIKGLAGYIDAASGRRLIFALFVYDPNRRQKLEATPRLHAPTIGGHEAIYSKRHLSGIGFRRIELQGIYVCSEHLWGHK